MSALHILCAASNGRQPSLEGGGGFTVKQLSPAIERGRYFCDLVLTCYHVGADLASLVRESTGVQRPTLSGDRPRSKSIHFWARKTPSKTTRFEFFGGIPVSHLGTRLKV